MSRFEVVRYIVVVPALRIIYPALTGQLTHAQQSEDNAEKAADDEERHRRD
jgi:ABC-type amino acid transport system permease subunit